MGPAAQALTCDFSSKQQSAALFGFPSPANDDVLETPTLIDLSARQSPLTSRLSDPDVTNPADPLSAVPDIVNVPPVLSPPCDTSCVSDMETVVGGALAPVRTSAPPPPAAKSGPGLQLPSFELLSIASPHPDRYGHGTYDGTQSRSPRGIGADHQNRMDPPHICLPKWLYSHIGPDGQDVLPIGGPQKDIGKPISTPLQQYVNVLTPPAEAGAMAWEAAATISTRPMHSPATESSSSTTNQDHSLPEAQQNLADATRNIDLNTAAPGEARPWISGAIQALLENLRTAREPNMTLRVLSHALPCPSEAGHVFPDIITSIHDSTPSSPTVWINVFHAVPGRFNLADLPTSPPATPGPPLGGDDYFTQKVFDSAVQVSDYQEDLAALPRSPRPVVPPSSINVSIVERYIPPTSPKEFLNMFEERGPSILIDRMVELSPNNGSLIFIYPTKVGAETFMHDYLSPILDPLLRAMVVVNGLSHDLSSSLGRMAAVDTLPSHETLKRRIQILCATLTQRSHSLERFHGKRAAFHLMYSAKKEADLDREVWAKDWWAKQEKPKIRTVVTRYANEAMAKRSNEHASQDRTPTHLVQELLDGVTSKPYSGDGPTKGVEVSVFVIKRSE